MIEEGWKFLGNFVIVESFNEVGKKVFKELIWLLGDVYSYFGF